MRGSDLTAVDPALIRTKGQVTDVQYHGDGTRLQLQLDVGASILAEVPNVGDRTELPERGAIVTVGFHRSDMLVLHGAGASQVQTHAIGETP